MKNAQGQNIRDVAMAEMSKGGSALAPEPSPGASPRGREAAGGGTISTQPSASPEGATTVAGAPDTGANRETFFEIEGKKYKVEVGEDGKVSSADVENILRDPYEAARRHSSSVADRQIAQAREKIRKEEFGNIQQELSETRKALAEMREERQRAAGAQPAKTAVAPEGVDWSKVDPTDNAQIFRAMQEEADLRARRNNQAMLDQMQVRDRYQADKTLREAAASWKEYDQDMFLRILADEGVVLTEKGPDYSKKPPHEVQDIAVESVKILAGLKATEERINSQIDKAISLMPVEFDQHLKDLVEMKFRAEMKKGRPYETEKDCLLIATEASKQVMENDNKRIIDRVSKIRASFEKNRGASQKNGTENAEPTVDNTSDLGKMSREDRHARIVERGKRDRTV